MNAYAIAQVVSVDFGPDIVEYLRRIDHMVANTILIEGVPDGYRGKSSLKYLLAEGS